MAQKPQPKANIGNLEFAVSGTKSGDTISVFVYNSNSITKIYTIKKFQDDSYDVDTINHDETNVIDRNEMLKNRCINVNCAPVIGNMTFKIDGNNETYDIIKKYKIEKNEIVIVNWDNIPIALEYKRENNITHIVKGYDAPTSFMTNVKILLANPNSQLIPKGQPSQPPQSNLQKIVPKPQPPPGPQPQKPLPPKGGRPNTVFCNARCKDGHTCKNKKATCMWHNKKSILHKKNAKTK